MFTLEIFFLLHFVTGSMEHAICCKIRCGKIDAMQKLKVSFLNSVQWGAGACVCVIDKVIFCGAWLLLTTNWDSITYIFFAFYILLAVCCCCFCCFELIHYTLRLHLCFVVTYKEILWDSSVSFFPPPPSPSSFSFFSPVFLCVNFFVVVSIYTFHFTYACICFSLSLSLRLFLFLFLFLYFGHIVTSKHDIRGYDD